MPLIIVVTQSWSFEPSASIKTGRKKCLQFFTSFESSTLEEWDPLFSSYRKCLCYGKTKLSCDNFSRIRDCLCILAVLFEILNVSPKNLFTCNRQRYETHVNWKVTIFGKVASITMLCQKIPDYIEIKFHYNFSNEIYNSWTYTVDIYYNFNQILKIFGKICNRKHNQFGYRTFDLFFSSIHIST